MAGDGLNLDVLMDALAERVAQKLAARLGGAETSAKPRLLTIERAADYLGRSANSVRHLVRSGKLPVVRLDDRVYLDLKDLDRAIEEAKQVAL